jgi:hypothetical protein
MRVLRQSQTIIALSALVFVSVYIYGGCKPVWQFNHLERNVKSAVTPSELQVWAASLLAQYPTNTWLNSSEIGTDFPQSLRALAPRLGPSVGVYSTNSPAFVIIAWGSGGLGHCGLEIGGTNFTGYRRGHAWQTGIYFWNDHGD